MRDKYFAQNKTELDALPNNTFQKLFNNPNGPSQNPSGQFSDKSILPQKQSPSSSIRAENVLMPPIASETPVQNQKQKARRLALASIDRRGMESLPNPQHINESFELGRGKQSNESFTPLRIGGQGTAKFKMSQLEIDQINESQTQANSSKPNPYNKNPSPTLDDYGTPPQLPYNKEKILL